MKWILFINSFLLYFSLICEDVIRPKEKKECFNRTFVGEFNKNNAYCCFLEIEKEGDNYDKCSIHFKNEIDNDKIYDTINFLKNVNIHYENEVVIIKSLDCECQYLNTKYLLLLFIFIIFEYFYL